VTGANKLTLCSARAETR